MTSQVRVGIGCFVTSNNHPNCILFGERKGSHGAGKLALPGGHLELGETWEECATREVKEETNLEIDNLKFVHVTNDPSIGGDINKHYITLFMRSTVAMSSPELINMEPHKCVEWKWVTWYDLLEIHRNQPSLLFDPLLHLLEQIDRTPTIYTSIFQK